MSGDQTSKFTLRTIRAIAILPFNVIVIIPALILLFWKTDLSWGMEREGIIWRTIGGVLLLGLGITILYLTNRLFIKRGKGTLAPWDPTRKLVIGGIYAYLRNPMISGVVLSIFGLGLLSGHTGILTWGGIFFVLNLLYIRYSEEPGLIKRFGSSYLRYKHNVPAWLPRLTPWTGPDGDALSPINNPPNQEEEEND